MGRFWAQTGNFCMTWSSTAFSSITVDIVKAEVFTHPNLEMFCILDLIVTK